MLTRSRRPRRCHGCGDWLTPGTAHFETRRYVECQSCRAYFERETQDVRTLQY